MADTNITIPELGSLTAGQVSDLLLVTRGTTGYKMLVSDIAKTIIETYAGSSLAGSTQSVKSALDSLNSRLTPITGALTDSKIPLYITKIGNMIYVRALYVAPTAVITSGEWTEIGTLPAGITVSGTNYIGGVFTSQTGETYGFRGSINANGKVGMVFEKTLNTNINLFGVAVSVS